MNDALIGARIWKQVKDIWLLPELDKRKQQNKSIDLSQIWGVQIMFVPMGNNEIRLNEEIKGKFLVKKTDNGGEILNSNQIKNVLDVILDDSDKDSGFITILILNGKGHVFFDAIYNATKVAKYISMLKEFLKGLKNLEKKSSRLAIDSLVTTFEIAIRARLLVHNVEIPDSGSHRKYQEKIDKYNKTSDVFSVNFYRSYNYARCNRIKARYNVNFVPDLKKIKTSIIELELMVKEIENLIKKRVQ